MIEAMKQALEALEDATKHIFLGDKNGVEANIRAHKQCESLRQAIKELENQEPVAWLKVNKDSWTISLDAEPDHIPLYTHPPQRKPLTNEQIYSMVADITDVRSPYLQFARAIEAAHGIKE